MAETHSTSIQCQFCKATFRRSKDREDKHPLQYCAYCGAHLKTSTAPQPSAQLDYSAVFVQEHKPRPEETQGAIGQYILLRSLGKGGMGEVFLAFDTVSGRQVALKRIRPDFFSTPVLKQRFLQEARITSQLIHPSIIPIYNIHIEGDVVYYTMPYVQGTTLRQLFHQAKAEEEAHGKPHTSITAFVRIFLSIAQAIAYAHSRGILHRDIKPENIIIGSYGQVIILDWGLTKLIEEREETTAREGPSLDPELSDSTADTHLTRAGKLVGTVAYMAPERARGEPASIQTDIYALGVILYQILTLALPFKRKNIDAFISSVDNEQLVAPEVRAPYRDVPHALSELTKNCLESDPKYRIQSCDEIVSHIENFLEGKSEWFFVQSLHLDKKNDWELQENVLFSEYASIFKPHTSTEWCRLMISKHTFSDNVRVSMKLTLHQGSQGIGILFAIPEEKERQSITDGYCLWLATEHSPEHGTMLLHSSLLVAEAPNVSLMLEHEYDLAIEKTDQSFILSIQGKEVFRHESHIPVIGSHIGLLVKDGFFTMTAFEVSEGSQNILVNCLAVPDAFLVARAYDRAFSAYNRLAELFIGRAEGREALFRAGVTLVENAKQQSDPTEREALLNRALSQFQRLRDTAGAPLEYLGKSYVYHLTREYEEEAKCFEMAFRKYQQHPYIRILHEQLIVRLHESLKSHRIAASHFIALALRYLPQDLAIPSTRKLLLEIKTEWEWPHYFPEKSPKGENKDLMLVALSFWLRLPFISIDLLSSFLSTPILPKKNIETALLTLCALGDQDSSAKAIQKCKDVLSLDEQELYAELFYYLSHSSETCLDHISKKIKKSDDPTLLHIRSSIVLFDHVLNLNPSSFNQEILLLFKQRAPLFPPLTARIVELLLHQGLYDDAWNLIEEEEARDKIEEKSPLFFFKGCFLAFTEGREAALRFFQSGKDSLYPPSWSVAPYVIAQKIQMKPKGWLSKAYPYEVETMERHMKLFNKVNHHE